MSANAACRTAPWALSGLAAVWLVLVGWLYYHGGDWGTLWKIRGYWPSLFPDIASAEVGTVLRDMKVLAELLWLVLLGRGAGAALLEYAGLNTGEKPGQFALSLAAGWGAMSLVMFGLGLAGAWTKPLLFTLLCAGSAALAVREYRDWRTPPPAAPPVQKTPLLSWNSVWFLILAAFAALNLLAAFVPEIFYDALVYHLALPDLYWKHGGVIATPWNLYSGLPQLVETLYSIALPVGGDGLARLIHWTFGLGTALLTYVIAARFAGKRTAALAALLFYTMPVVGVLSGQSMTDLGWAFFQLSALYALCLRLEAPDASWKWTVLAGVLAGFAMGSRYQAWPPCIIMWAVLAWKLRSGGKSGRVELFAFAAAALAVLSPWLIKNAVFYHNPVYPFFHEYFSAAQAPGWRAMLADGGGRDLGLVFSTWAGARAYLLYLWTYTFSSNDLGPALLLMFPVLIFCRFLGAQLRFLQAVFFLLWFTGSLLSGSARFLLPCVPLACVLFSAALEDGLHKGLRKPVYAGLLFVFSANFLLQALIFKAYGADKAVLGRETAADYLRAPHKTYPRPPYAGLEFINSALPPGARVLFVGEARGFYCRRDYVAGTLFDEPPLREWLRGSRDAAGLLSRFQREGITHVLVNQGELESWRKDSPGYMALNARESEIFADFNKRYLKLLFEDKTPPGGWVQVLEVSWN